MTEAIQKKCTNPKCNNKGQLQPRANFHRDGRYKDGLQSWCILCTRTYKDEMKSKPLPTPKGVKLGTKAIDIIKALPTHSYNMSKAYSDVVGGTAKSPANSSKVFWDAVGNDEVALDIFRSYLANDMKEINLNNSFTTYFQRAMIEGSLGEQNSALNLTFKVLGWLDKRGIDVGNSKPKTKEDRLKERAEYLKQLEQSN